MLVRTRQFLTLARLAALETIRQPICLLLATTCVVLSGLVPLLVLHNFGENGKLVRDSCFAFHLMFGIFVAGYASASTLAREMRSGTASTVLSKPVDRQLFFLSKFAGVTTVILAFSACATLATLLSERTAEKFLSGPHIFGYVRDSQTGILLLASPLLAFLVAGLMNYLRRRPFGSCAFWSLLFFLALSMVIAGLFDQRGSFAPFHLRVDHRTIPISALITLALITLSAIALTISTRLSTVPTLCICLIVLAGGLLSDYLLGRHAPHSALAALLYSLTPNWQHFWVPDALINNGSVPWSYVLTTSVYAAIYTGGIICLGMLSFQNADTA